MLIKITVLKSGLVSRYPVEYSFWSKDSGIQTVRQGTCTSSFIQQIVTSCVKFHSKPGEAHNEQNSCSCRSYILRDQRQTIFFKVPVIM